MHDERDPDLQALFAAADEDLPEDGFVRNVLARIEADQRMRVRWMLLVGVLMATLLWVFGPALQQTVSLLTDALTAPLVVMEVMPVVAPLNSVAAPVGVGFLMIWRLYRRARHS